MKKFKFIKLIIVSIILAALSGSLLNTFIEKKRSSNNNSNMIYTQTLKVSPSNSVEIKFMKFSTEKSNTELFDVQKNAEEFFYKLNLGMIKGCNLDKMGSQTLPVEINQENINFPVTNIIMYQKDKQVLLDCRKALYSFFDKKQEKVKKSLINIVNAEQSDSKLRLFGELVKLQLTEIRDTEKFDEKLKTNIVIIERVETQLKKLEQEILKVKKARIADLVLYDKVYDEILQKRLTEFTFIKKLSFFICFILSMVIIGLYFYSRKDLREIKQRFLHSLSKI